MRRFVPLFLGLTAMGPEAAAQAGGPTLTLQEAVELAVRNNPAYLQSTTGRTRAGAAVRSAYGSLLPNVNTSFGSSFREGRQQFFAGQAFGSTSDVLSSNSDLSLNAQYSRQSFLGIKQQKANLDAAEADVTNAAAQLRANVITQYLNVLQAQARAAFQDTLLVSTQAQLELARARLQVGAAISLDVRRAEVQVGQQQVARLREQNNAELEKLRLFQQMGVDQPADVRLTTAFGIEEPKVQLQEVMDLARRSNPALQALQSRQRSADVAVSSARASYLPTLSLQTGVSGFSQQLTNLDGQIAEQQGRVGSSRASCFTTDSIRRGAGLSGIGALCNQIAFTPAQEQLLRDNNAQFPFKFTRSPINFGMQVSLPIFDGFQREQRVQEAAAQRNDSRYRLREQELRLTTDVTSAYRNLTTAYQTVRLQEQNSATAREAVALAQERFRIGTNTFVEVTQARSDFERAETDRINAIYDYHKAFAALEGAVGRPLR
jgi:outer membrane protein